MKNKIALLIAVVVFSIYIFLSAANYFAFFGVQKIHYGPFVKSGMISDVVASGDIGLYSYNSDLRRYYSEIKGHTLDFVITQREGFDRAEVELGFKEGVTKFLEMSLVDVNGKVISSRVIHNEIFDFVAVEGYERLPYVQDGDAYSFFQKEKTSFASANDFVTSSGGEIPFSSQFKRVLVDKKQQPDQLTVKPDVSQDDSVFINAPLRGKHRAYVYVSGDVFELASRFSDINRKDGPDRFNIFLRKGGENVRHVQVQDDGVVKASGVRSGQREARMVVDGLDSGIYEVFFDISPDLIIEVISANVGKFQFVDSVFLAGNEEYGYSDDSIAVFSNAEQFVVKTTHDTGFQNIGFGDRGVLRVDERIKRFAVQRAESEGLLAVPSSDCEVENFYNCDQVNSYVAQGDLTSISLEKGDVQLWARSTAPDGLEFLDRSEYEVFYKPPQFFVFDADHYMDLGLQYQYLHNDYLEYSDYDYILVRDEVAVSEPFDVSGVFAGDGEQAFRVRFSNPYNSQEDTLMELNTLDITLYK